MPFIHSYFYIKIQKIKKILDPLFNFDKINGEPNEEILLS